jgi:carboxyl-terminal processing protease
VNQRSFAIALVAATACAGSVPATAPAPATLASIDSSLAAATFDSAWHRIATTYYDSAMRGIDWRAVRTELRPRAARARTSGELRAVLASMIERLGESHFAVIPAERASALDRGSDRTDGEAGLGLRLVGDRLAVFSIDTGSPAWNAGVRTGWELLSVDGVPVDSLLRAVGLAVEQNPALVPFVAVRAAEARLAGSAGTQVSAEFQDGTGAPRPVRMERVPARGQPVTFGLLPTVISRVESARRRRGELCAGVVRFNAWMAPVAAAIDSAITAHADCAGIVLDLRGNPGGLAAMVMGVAGHFLETPDSLGTMRMRSATVHLVANPRYGASGSPNAGRLAIVVDELSASTSEIFAAALQQLGRARVFGSQTPGFALPALMARLPNGDLLMHVVADFTLPRGGRVEATGVVPDVEVRLTLESLLSGRDLALESAVDWIVEDPHNDRHNRHNSCQRSTVDAIRAQETRPSDVRADLRGCGTSSAFCAGCAPRRP